MPGWSVFQWFFLLVLIIFVGIPLYIKELLTGSQEGRMMDWFERQLSKIT